MSTGMKARNKEMLHLYINERMTLEKIGDIKELSKERVRQVLMSFPEYRAVRIRRKLNRQYRCLLTELAPYKKNEKAIEKFWSQIDKGGDDECWEWTGYKNPTTGYGIFHNKCIMDAYNVSRAVHNQSWCIHSGKQIPEGMWVLHICDNPSCANPHHLYLGTPADNVRDRQERSGWIDYTRKLSTKEVETIRNIFDREGIDCIYNLAEVYAVTAQYIYMIGKRLDSRSPLHNYKHLQGA